MADNENEAPKIDKARKAPKLAIDRHDVDKVASGEVVNPAFVCMAGAAYEASRALRLFMGEQSADAKMQFSELDKPARQDMIDDAMLIVAGKTPEDLYHKYNQTGTLWGAVDPIEKVLWVTFAAQVNLQFHAIRQLAGAMEQVKAGADDGQ